MKVIIIGAGKLGYKLAEALINSDVEVTVVDSKERVIKHIREYLDVLTITANGTDMDVLKSLNLKSYALLVATTNSDETNTIICALAKTAGCKQTIARIRNPEYSQQLDFLKIEMGIDHIVNPELSTANKIARYLTKEYIFYSENFARGQVSMIDCHERFFSGFKGKIIKDIDDMEGLLIAAISRRGEIIIPSGLTTIEEDDILYVIGKTKMIKRFSHRADLDNNRSSVKRVMILGGGKIGYYLAKRLLASRIQVTIIESDEDRCRYLSEKLDNALVIKGNGTDINILEEEKLPMMDAFIGVTGFDEQNLLMSLMAKQEGVKKVIAKISKPSYNTIIDKLGIDVALNPTEIIASDILRFIRGGKVLSVSMLLGGQAEVIEIVVSKDMAICDKKISNLALPKGIIIGAIVDKNDVIIPNGQSMIEEDSRLILFSLAKDISMINKILKPSRKKLL
ncbi:Trk system potassium transporter TrkA [Petrocella atlantisensis]|uniref:Trk system potassium uptake protein TrkA n=1 Tax=Petrocella atlantisensis TaxID=2173034 RepID=A0A3P7RZA6_9FIRM|nr:Trk system potassium transporter TrkA [Petrocella atlantisensis]VDN46039.1 Trk system potassium transporter TrkA [Petrocella atlantisensis]